MGVRGAGIARCGGTTGVEVGGLFRNAGDRRSNLGSVRENSVRTNWRRIQRTRQY